MKSRILLALAVMTFALAACGGGDTSITLPSDGDAPVLQVRSEGGFTMPEALLNRPPRFTLLADGRLIYDGPVIAIYPGPLLPNLQQVTLTNDEMEEVLAMIAEMGMPQIVEESDDSNANFIADATTEVLTYWDREGPHVYSAYALGLGDSAESRTTAFRGLVELLDGFTASRSSVEYQSVRVQIYASISYGAPDPEFVDVREWPLAESPETFDIPTDNWGCRVFDDPSILDAFSDATQVTEWSQPSPDGDSQNVRLLVRPLLPGEEGCIQR